MLPACSTASDVSCLGSASIRSTLSAVNLLGKFVSSFELPLTTPLMVSRVKLYFFFGTKLQVPNPLTTARTSKLSFIEVWKTLSIALPLQYNRPSCFLGGQWKFCSGLFVAMLLP